MAILLPARNILYNWIILPGCLLLNTVLQKALNCFPLLYLLGPVFRGNSIFLKRNCGYILKIGNIIICLLDRVMLL